MSTSPLTARSFESNPPPEADPGTAVPSLLYVPERTPDASDATPYLADPGEIEPFAAPSADPVAETATPVVDVPANEAAAAETPAAETSAVEATAEVPAPAAPGTIKPAPAASPSRKRRQPASPKLPSALKGGGSAT